MSALRASRTGEFAPTIRAKHTSRLSLAMTDTDSFKKAEPNYETV